MAHQEEVIVDGFGHAHHGALVTPLHGLAIDGVRPRVGSVAAQHEQDVDAPGHDGVHNFWDVAAATGGAQHGAALQVDVLHVLPGQLLDL